MIQDINPHSRKYCNYSFLECGTVQVERQVKTIQRRLLP
jgi:hypothetical protein